MRTSPAGVLQLRKYQPGPPSGEPMVWPWLAVMRLPMKLAKRVAASPQRMPQAEALPGRDAISAVPAEQPLQERR